MKNVRNGAYFSTALLLLFVLAQPWVGRLAAPETDGAAELVDHGRGNLALLTSGMVQTTREDQWEKEAIDLKNSPSFRLVQVALINPDPVKDLVGLKRFFYIGLDVQPFRRDTLWRKDL